MAMAPAEGEAAASDFPITWDDPEHEKRAWFQDVMHNPLPVTPLSATLFQTGFVEGVCRAFEKMKAPMAGLQVSVQNGYVYLSRIPPEGDEAALEARAAEGQRIAVEITPTVLKDWRETFEPMVLERAKEILEYDYDGASLPELARFALGMKDALAYVWEIHMRVNIPPMGAVFALEDMLSNAVGQEAVAQSRELLQGFDNKSVETGRTLWALSRWIRSDAALREAVMAAKVRAGTVDVTDTPKTAEFQRRWKEFLDTYGWRSDIFMEFGHPSWREDPSTALTQLKGYVSKDDDADPFAAHARYAAERDRQTAELEARLPEDVRPMFRLMLPVAQQYIPIAEDHNFTIDQKFTMVVRHALLQFGKRLQSVGALSDPDDVFYLVFNEIESIANGSEPGDLSSLARQRRRERAKQATMRAPIMIGTPPPPDEMDPVVGKFFGVGLAPSEDAGIVTGHPCSNGVVTGIAKVVRTLDEADKLEPGDILVCRMTMPAWTPLFGVAAAVVADSGGPLSHCAIVAREYGIPCVAGTVNGTTLLADGMRIRVDGGQGIVTVLREGTRG